MKKKERKMKGRQRERERARGRENDVDNENLSANDNADCEYLQGEKVSVRKFALWTDFRVRYEVSFK